MSICSLKSCYPLTYMVFVCRKAIIDRGQVYNYFMAEYLHSSEEIAPAKKYLSIEILCFFNMKSKAFFKTYLIHETNP